MSGLNLVFGWHGNIANVPKTTDAAACEALCKSQHNCTYGTWHDEHQKGWIHRTVKEQLGRMVLLLPTQGLPQSSCDVSRTRLRTICCKHVGGKSKRSFDNFSCSLACDHPGECLRPIVTDKRKRFATGVSFDADIKVVVLNHFSDKIAKHVLTAHHKSNTVPVYRAKFRQILSGQHPTLSIHVPRCDNDSFVKNIFRMWGDSFHKWSLKIPQRDKRNEFDRGNGHAALSNVFKAGEERVQCLFEESIMEAPALMRPR